MPSPLNNSTTTPQARLAMWMLVFATIFWGASFTWAKNLGEAFNAASGFAGSNMFGPLAILAIRFLFAGILWVVIFPAARRGWSILSFKRSVIIAGLFAGGMVFQMLGLSHTSEAVSAFLTGLTVVFVPLILTIVSRQLPGVKIICAILLAIAGIWMMTGATPAGFGLGELLGLSCAFVFSFGLIALNYIVPKDSAWRITAGMFFGISGICLIAALFFKRGHTINWSMLVQPKTMIELVLLTVLSTVLAFGIMNVFQPLVDVTRAAIIYLIEPIAAAMFAWVMESHAMTVLAIFGAMLILLANMVAEMQWGKKQQGETGKNIDFS